MNSSIAVSIIIPVYNAQNYIPEMLRSLQRQTFEEEFEMICVDDCSTDGSLKILNDFAKNDERIVIIENKENMGCAKSRQKALGRARGKYIAFVDADDTVNEKLLSTCFNAAEMRKADIVVFEALCCSKDKQTVFLNNGYYLKMLNKGNLEYLAFVTNLWCCFINKEIIIDNDIIFPNKRIFEDWVFLWTVFSVIKKAVYIDYPLYYYRVEHDGNSLTVSGKNDSSTLIDIFDAYDDAKKGIAYKWNKYEYICLLRANEIFLHFIKNCKVSKADLKCIIDRYSEFLNSIPEILFIRLFRNGLNEHDYNFCQLVREAKGDSSKNCVSKAFVYANADLRKCRIGISDSMKNVLVPFRIANKSMYLWIRQLARLFYNIAKYIWRLFELALFK